MPTQNTKSKSKSTLEEYVKEMLDKYEFNDAYTVMLGVALMNYKTAAFLCLNITADYKKAKDRRRNSKTVKELWKIYKSYIAKFSDKSIDKFFKPREDDFDF